jgi:anaerobic magnesium-protoporphyrin IX monomethyl ester cyclase
VDEGKHAVQLVHNAGIEVAAFFIVGYPGETVPAIEDTFRFALELPLDSISFNVPYPLPGSQLFEHVSKVDTTNDWNVENEVTFLYESEFDPNWLQRRIGETMQAFAGRKI